MFLKLNAILSLFSIERPEWTAPDVAHALKMPRSTTYRLLARIAEAGYLDLDESTGRYRLGIKLASLGSVAQRSTTLQRAAHSVLQRISAETQETATLVVRGGSEAITVDVAMSVQPLMVPALLGARMPFHASAGGKVLLAWMPDSERRAIIRGPHRANTPNTITDPDLLEREINKVRDQGYSIVRGEWADEVFAVAAPVRNFSGSVVGALTTGGPRSRVSDERLQELTGLIIDAASQVSAAIGHIGSGAGTSRLGRAAAGG